MQIGGGDYCNKRHLYEDRKVTRLKTQGIILQSAGTTKLFHFVILSTTCCGFHAIMKRFMKHLRGAGGVLEAYNNYRYVICFLLGVFPASEY
jgi:hypothetical protein